MRIVLFGDSVFAGHGLAPDEGPSAQLARLLPYDAIIAAGVPDQTSASGLARAASIGGELVLVEFGLNDAIAGVDPAQVVANLRAVVAALSPRALLVEALVPATSRWPACSDLSDVIAAAAGGAAWEADVLAGLGDESLMQADGLHPDARGARRIAERLAAAIDRRRTT